MASWVSLLTFLVSPILELYLCFWTLRILKAVFFKIQKIGTSIGLITPLDLYKLATDSIVNQSARSHVLNFLSKHQNNLELVAWPGIIGPLVVASLYYGYLRSTLTQDDFIFSHSPYLLPYKAILNSFCC